MGQKGCSWYVNRPPGRRTFANACCKGNLFDQHSGSNTTYSPSRLSQLDHNISPINSALADTFYFDLSVSNNDPSRDNWRLPAISNPPDYCDWPYSQQPPTNNLYGFNRGAPFRSQSISNRFTNIVLKRWSVGRKLHSNTRNEVTSMANVTTTACEEKACPKALLLIAFTGHRARNCRLSRAGQAIEPKDASWSCPSAQLYISRRTWTRVLSRQVDSCCLWIELKGASTAYGKRLSVCCIAKLPSQRSPFIVSYTNHSFL